MVGQLCAPFCSYDCRNSGISSDFLCFVAEIVKFHDLGDGNCVVRADKSLAVLLRFTGGRHEKIETYFRIEEGILVFGSMFLVSFCWVIDVYSRDECS